MTILLPLDSASGVPPPGLLILYTALVLASIPIYCVYFHPLRHIPGNKFAAFSKIPFALSLVKGTFHQDIRDLHEKYGEVIRFTPNHISFTHPDAWNAIYNYRSGTPHFTKDKMNYLTPVNRVESIHSTPDDVAHSRMRRLLSHAFSEKALREQEELVNSYINLLIKRLHEECDGPNKGKVDIVRWLNWTTFDLVGDLTFGEPFNCLASSDYHPWIAIVFESMRAAIWMVAANQFPQLASFLARFIPKQVKQKMLDHHNLSAEKMDRRLTTKTERPDFVTYLVNRSGPNGFNLQEMHSNSTLIILGGSETSATALSGAIFHLSKNPDKFQKLVGEIRNAIKTNDDFTFNNLAHLKYLNACLEESMRIYPPVAGYLPRVAPKEGMYVAGYWVPPGTQASITAWAITHSPANFSDPDKYIPERWLETETGPYASDKRAASQPFSVGPRNCIGKNLAWAEMRLILAKLLWNFDIEVCEESRDWITQKTFILWEKPPLVLQLTPRKAG
ncbi:toxin biosynthesis cytochrome P450 monooxygenase [Lepidopterella palustris CBS 459.81]|uniref:Toxin biosynthesis cytochrome P450 monooxygenase n=1 Tax=Lepidopterella palustris CBS 459.81 TaxID=1314670 RepID=A0A8E2JB77_9PEZI|nr:toxin biosynthesis cytochrome P450 monooxygenase [Lepidopterella palustris CBS 459.81]